MAQASNASAVVPGANTPSSAFDATELGSKELPAWVELMELCVSGASELLWAMVCGTAETHSTITTKMCVRPMFVQPIAPAATMSAVVSSWCRSVNCHQTQ